jgi:type IV pilus assembly protein PilY1
LDPSQAASYLEFDINASQGPLRGPGRTDCANERCTQTEERQNFANWFVYYRSRHYLARAALGEALLSQSNRVRVGYARLSTRVTGVSVDGAGDYKMIESGVRDWDLAQKQRFADWLYQAPIVGGSTPLVAATKEVGSYYERSDSEGPWGETPGKFSSAVQASCRRSYLLMMTDGFFTDGTATSKNIDSEVGPVITLANGSTWQYKPTRP